MSEDNQSNKGEQKKLKIISLVLIALIILSAFYIITTGINTSEDNKNYQERIIYLTADEAWELMNNTDTLYVIDVRSCKCNFDDYTLTKDTIYVKYLHPEEFYNSTEYDLTYDILVYDNLGNDTYTNQSNYFCQEVIKSRRVSGTVYCLEGGISAWRDKDYPYNEKY